jgi:hypothetical protein
MPLGVLKFCFQNIFNSQINRNCDNSDYTYYQLKYGSGILMHISDPLVQQIVINDLVEMLLYIAGSILSGVLVALSIFSYQ